MGENTENSERHTQTGWLCAKGTGRLGWLAVAGFLFVLYFQICDVKMAGFLHDDGVYALTAKALATGQGYKLLNLPLYGTTDFMWQVKYPIGYPLLLSLGWLFEPSFPKNLPWLHALTILCAVLAIPLLYDYLRRARQVGRAFSGLLCLLVATNFQYMYYATALMSEAPYFLCSLLALWLAETGDGPPSRKRLAGMVAAVVVSFHVRTVGITLMAAIFLGLLLRKYWKSASFFAISSALLSVIPWWFWIKTHAVKLTSLNFPLAYVYGGYGIEAAVNAPHGGLINYGMAIITQGLLPLINNLPNLLFPQLTLWLGHYPALNTLLSLALAGIIVAQAIQDVRHRRGDISGMYLLMSLSVVCVWMYPNQAIRFLLVLLPWLWLYTLRTGLNLLRAGFASLPANIQSRVCGHSLRPGTQWVTACLLGIFLLWPGLPGYQFLYRLRDQHLVDASNKIPLLWEDYQAAFQAINSQAKPSTRIASIWDPVFYLYTGHPTFPLFVSSLQKINGQVTEESYQRLRASLIKSQVKFMVIEPFIMNQVFQQPENPVAAGLLQRFPQDFRLTYVSPRGMLQIYRFTAGETTQTAPAMAETKE